MLTEGAAAPVPRRGAGLAALLLLAVGIVPYLRTLDVHFLKDDLNLLQLADAEGRPSFEAYRRWFLWPKGVYAHDEFYRPLPPLLGLAEFALAGPDPRLFRASNVLCHALNGLLIALLLDRLAERRRPAAAFFAGAAFALHPLHGEAVVWIAQRFVLHELFWTLVALLALDAWIRRRRAAAAVGVAAASLAALLTKETASALPAIFAGFVLCHPAAPKGGRLALAVRVGATAALVPATILGLRYAIFGTLVGTYGAVPVAEYAARARTFERIPESLLNGALATHPDMTAPATRAVVAAAWGLAALAAMLGLLRGLRDRVVLRVAAFGVAFGVLSLAPILPIFLVDARLAGGRFLYQPAAGAAIALAAGAFRATEARRAPPSLWPAALAATTGALVLQWNLAAYDAADAQIRSVRDGVLKAAAARPDAVFVLHGTPTDRFGVPTIDRYAPLLVRRPLAPSDVPLAALVAGEERAFDAAAFAAARARAGGGPLVHLRVVGAPGRVGPMFGAPRPAEGDAPEILEPEDGAVVGCPDFRGRAVDAAAILRDEPVIAFRPVPGAARYRVRLAVLEAGPEGSPAAPRAYALTLDPASRCEARDGALVYRFSRRADEIPADGPDPWTLLAVAGFEPPPLLMTWSLEALDAAGAAIGASAERRLVIYPARPPRP